jgi:hypothetical protein
MANFIYSHSDLDRPLVDVIGGPGLNLESFGLDQDKYSKVEQVDYDLFEKKEKINDDFVKLYGFTSFEDFMNCYCRCHIFNNYISKNKNSLYEFLMLYYSKALRFHHNDKIQFPPTNGNLLDYFKSYKPDWLLSIGW